MFFVVVCDVYLGRQVCLCVFSSPFLKRIHSSSCYTALTLVSRDDLSLHGIHNGMRYEERRGVV